MCFGPVGYFNSCLSPHYNLSTQFAGILCIELQCRLEDLPVYMRISYMYVCSRSSHSRKQRSSCKDWQKQWCTCMTMVTDYNSTSSPTVQFLHARLYNEMHHPYYHTSHLVNSPSKSHTHIHSIKACTLILHVNSHKQEEPSSVHWPHLLIDDVCQVSGVRGIGLGKWNTLKRKDRLLSQL